MFQCFVIIPLITFHLLLDSETNVAVPSVFIDSGGVKETVAVLFFNFALRFHFHTLLPL